MTDAPSTVTVAAGGGSAPTSTALATIGAHSSKKSTPIGAIVGGAVGGVVAITIIAVLAFFLFRKYRNKTNNEQHQGTSAAATAWHNQNQIPEIGGKPATQQQVYAAGGSAYTSAQNEKPVSTQQEAFTPSSQNHEYYTPQKPASPIYSQPNSSNRPPSNVTELDPRASTQPVSPMTTGAQTSSELGGDTRVNSPALQHTELGGQNRGSYQIPAHVSEIGGGSSTGGITRAPAAQQRQTGATDMSGAPMSEEYHHELE